MPRIRIEGQADSLTDEGGLQMLLGIVVLVLVLSEAFLVYFLVAISRDKLVTRAGLEFHQFEMPVLGQEAAYAAPSSGKVKNGLASEITRINWRKRNLAPDGLVLLPDQRVPAGPKRQRARDKF